MIALALKARGGAPKTIARKRFLIGWAMNLLAERLIAEGAMTPRGLAEVERAKADGRWDSAYDSPSTMTVPDELATALAAIPGAREFFDGLDSRNRFAILHRITTVKRAETRSRKIEQYAEMLGNHERLYP